MGIIIVDISLFVQKSNWSEEFAALASVCNEMTRKCTAYSFNST